MATQTLPTLVQLSHPHPRVALLGNPNAGKTALFNALTGLRGKIANFPGVTVDVRVGKLKSQDVEVELLDLPGLYSLDAMTPEERVTSAILREGVAGHAPPDAAILVLDATNLERNLFLASEILELGIPVVVALTLYDAAQAAGIEINVEQLEADLSCPVIAVSARTGEGLQTLRERVGLLVNRESPEPAERISCTANCGGCTFAARYQWAGQLAQASARVPVTHGRLTAAIDRVLTQPAIGVAAFLTVMLGVFYLIFALAGIPMDLIEMGFGIVAAAADAIIPTMPLGPLWHVGVFVAALGVILALFRPARLSWTPIRVSIAAAVSLAIAFLPLHEFRSLVVDGVIGGIGGVLVFLPQICILFFFIALLEDSGYLARAAFVMERIMRAVGLPGKAFVPMLSAHACAIPGIMATRVIEDWRDRLVTIMVLPLLTCSARLPVYAMVAALLFSDSPGLAALLFLGAYLLGIIAALGVAWVLKRTILRGETVPLVLELPQYRWPSFRNAVVTVVDRASVFVRRAGTIILAISVILWALSTYPRLPEPTTPGVAAEAAASETERAQQQLAYSFAGRTGRALEPLFRPLGFDWKLNVGVVSSFAAREVIVSTLAVIYGLGEEAAEDNATLTEILKRQRHPDGRPVYTTATCGSLLVFYVLAMQCLPTQAVTRRETGSWKWAFLQLGYMTVLAYVAAAITYQLISYFS